MDKKKIAKFTVSIVLLVALFRYVVDWSKFLESLRGIKLKYYVIGYLFATSSTLVSVYRWDKILKFDNQEVKFTRLISLYYIGKFYNLLIPGSISGDAVRGYKTSKEKGDSTKLASSVAVERIVGLIAVLLVMLTSLIYLRNTIPFEVSLQLLFFSLATFTGLLVITNQKAVNFVLNILPDYYFLTKIKKETKKLSNSINNLRNYKYLAKLVSISLIFILLSQATTYFIALSVGAHISYTYILAVTTIIGLITMIPLSFGGLGIREGLFVYFFGLVGISSETAVALGLIGYSMRVINAIIGGLINLIEK